MKQIFYNDKGDVYIKEIAPPTLQGAGAIVETVCSFIGTGSELHGIRRARQTPGTGSKEHAMNYQSCGRIVELSPEIEGFQLGDLVACAGSGFGAHAEMNYAPKNTFAKVPDGVTPAEAASCNLGLTAVHALRRGHFEFGETVVVIGLGLVGQLLSQLIHSAGGFAIGTDLIDSRLGLASKLGLDVAINPQRDNVAEIVRHHTDGVGADIVIICAAAPESSAPLELACEIARDKGRVVVAGLIKIDIPFFSLRGKELDLLISRGRGPGTGDPTYERQGVDYPLPYVRWTENRNLEEYLRLIASKAIKVDPLITHRVPVDRAAEGIEALFREPENALGVVIEY